MRTKRRVTAALSLLAVIGLAATACGSSKKSSSAGTTAGTSATTAAATATTASGGAATTASGGAATTASGGAATTAGGAATTASGACASPKQNVPVGLLYDVTGRGDYSFNDAAAAGADQAKKDFNIKLTESTPSGDADRPQRINLLSQSNELITGVGFLWSPDVDKAAKANPNLKYAIVDDTVTEPNVRSLLFTEEQSSYLVGVAAALKSKAKHVGFIGGVENDLIKKFEAGYTAGVHSVDPSIKVDVKYITQPPDFTGFNDAAKAKIIGASMYQGGADVVYHAAGGSGTGLFAAAKEAGKPGSVWAIGVDGDQYNQVSADLKPYILTSALKRVDTAVYNTIRDYVCGNFTAGVQTFDLKANGVGYATSGGFVDDIKDKLEAAKADIISGKVVVPTKPAS
jgi:basic membrane protein A